ncbi:putative porin [Acinetobacter sp. NIPH 2699]|uniref:putative porin n=1 Tax=Acinetobacter sp. NIPH 2699 TaxID=2923433 RepID=UPI001F4AF842|nr:putative porin [Acinetobacter sp. NIPH 2699]MCH7335726.1 putative porin [Acinetobacter sp. NIPH 2699]
MKKLSLATALFASVFALNTNAYQTEVAGAYEYTYIKDSELDSHRVNTVSLNGKYYFNPVQTRSAPLAEAAFLDKTSNIGLGYTYAKESGQYPITNIFGMPLADVDLKREFNSLGINGEFFIPNSQFYVAGSLHRTEIDTTAKALGYSYKFASNDGNGYSIEAGFLPINGLLFAVGIADLSESFDPAQAAQYGFITTYSNAAAVSGEDEDTAVTLRAKYVSQIAGFYTNFEGQTYIGDETTYRLAADLYLDPTLSVGISFADSTADDSDSIFNIRAKKFITPEFAIGVGYTTIDGANSYGINGTFRF